MKTHKIVKVEWNDSCNYRGWNKFSTAEEFDPMPCVSSGILVKVKRGNIGITHSTSNHDVAETIVISRKSIRSIKVIDTFKL